jgi:hypothetical protein
VAAPRRRRRTHGGARVVDAGGAAASVGWWRRRTTFPGSLSRLWHTLAGLVPSALGVEVRGVRAIARRWHGFCPPHALGVELGRVGAVAGGGTGVSPPHEESSLWLGFDVTRAVSLISGARGPVIPRHDWEVGFIEVRSSIVAIG